MENEELTVEPVEEIEPTPDAPNEPVDLRVPEGRQPQPEAEQETISDEEWAEFQAFKASKAVTPRIDDNAPAMPRQDAQVDPKVWLSDIAEKLQYGDADGVAQLISYISGAVQDQIGPIKRQSFLAGVDPDVRQYVIDAEKEIGVSIADLPPNQQAFVMKAAADRAKLSAKPKPVAPRTPSGLEPVVPGVPTQAISKELQGTYKDYLKMFGLEDSAKARKEFLEL
jgi:hypothetical protein